MDATMTFIIVALAIIGMVLPFMLSTHDDEDECGEDGGSSNYTPSEVTHSSSCVLIEYNWRIQIPSDLEEDNAFES